MSEHKPRERRYVDRAYQYSTCRAIGHAWFEVPTDWVPQLGVGFTLRCERCGAERRDTVHRDWGELVSRSYVYPEGYSYEGDEAKPKRMDFLLDLLDRREKRGHRRGR